MQYIEDIVRGITSPSNDYIDEGGSRFGQIDYVSSVYVMRFKPTSYPSLDNIIYIGKGCGIFPISFPDKEIIGRRDTNELTTVPISYSCTMFRRYLSYAASNIGSYEHHDWVGEEFSDYVSENYNQKINMSFYKT